MNNAIINLTCLKSILLVCACAWFVVLSVVVVAAPKTVGTWQAQVEQGFFEEAERIGLWEEETY